jgi:hypothetical protein
LASDLLNTLAAIHREEESRVSIPRRRMANTTTAHGCLMLTVLDRLAEFDLELIRSRTG